MKKSHLLISFFCGIGVGVIAGYLGFAAPPQLILRVDELRFQSHEDIEEFIAAGNHVRPAKGDWYEDLQYLWCYPIHLVCDSGDSQAVWAFLEAGVDPQTKDSDGCPPLDYLLFSDRFHDDKRECLQLLVEYGADLNEIYGDGSGYQRAAIHRAADFLLPAQIRTLCRLGADVNVVDRQGNTPLHIVAQDKPGSAEVAQWIETLRTLSELGADWYAVRNDGRQPVDLCREHSTVIGQDNLQLINEFAANEVHGVPLSKPR